jgi:lipopolysaccharide export system permease protein
MGSEEAPTMIRILDRLVVRSFMKVFLAFVVGAPILFILGDVTESLDRYLDRGLSWGEVARAYLYQLPQFIQWSFPIAALVAAVFTIQTMTQHREIVAAKAGGISFHRLILPMVFLGVLLMGIALGLEEVVPRTNRTAGEILQQIDVRRDFRSNFVFQGDQDRNFAIRSLNVTQGLMSGIVMETVKPGSNRPSDHLMADMARHDRETGWTFQSGYYRILPEDGEELAFKFGTAQIRGFEERPEDFLEVPRKHEEMTYQEKGRMADIIRRSGGDPSMLLVRQQKSLAIPAATLVIILFGAPLATSSKRGGTAYGIGVALISTILYLLLFRITEAIGDTGGLSPFMAAWTPNFLFLGAGLLFLIRVRT